MTSTAVSAEDNTGIITREEAPLRGSDGRFLPGKSGNPTGRPKRTAEEQKVLDDIKALAPQAVKRLAELLNGKVKISPYALLQAISLVLDRTFGRPEAALRVAADLPDDMDIDARIEALMIELDRDNPRGS